MAPSERIERPEWWDWDLELSTHLLKRMEDRHFDETDLRVMFESAVDVRESEEPDRWVVGTTHDGKHWEVVVEPDPVENTLVVVTAYAVEAP